MVKQYKQGAKMRKIGLRRLLLIGLVCGLVSVLFVLPNQIARAGEFTVSFDEGGYPFTVVEGTLDAPGGDYDSDFGGYWLRSDSPPGQIYVEVNIPVNPWDTITNIKAGYWKEPNPPYGQNINYSFELKSGGTQVAYASYNNPTVNNWWDDYTGRDLTGFTGGDTLIINVNGNVAGLGIDSIRVTLSGDVTTPTPNFTPTATATLPPIGVPYPSCTLLGDHAAVFYNFPGAWQRLAGTTSANPPGHDTSVLLPRTESIGLPLKLIPTHQYSILTYWQIAHVDSNQYFEVTLGNSAPYSVAMAEDTDEHSYTIPKGNYSSDSSGNYTLVIAVPNLANEPDLQVNYICVIDTTSGTVGAGGTGGSAIVVGSCAECIYAPVGDLFQDVPKVVSWIWCAIRRLVECDIMGVIMGIWDAIVKIIMFFASVISWLIRTAVAVYDFFVSSGLVLARYAGGTINNAAALGANAINESGMPNVVSSILDTANNLPIALQNLFYQGLGMVGALLNSGADAFSLIVGLIRFFLDSIAMLINVIPQLFIAWVQAFNAASSGTLAGMPSCSDPNNLLYTYCLGLYIADNTIFSGPAFYLLPIFETILLWNTIVWVVGKFQKAFSGDA